MIITLHSKVEEKLKALTEFHEFSNPSAYLSELIKREADKPDFKREFAAQTERPRHP